MGKKDKVNLPEAFTEKMRGLLGDEFDEFLASYDYPSSPGIRINTLKVGLDDFLARWPGSGTLEKVPWAPTGFYHDPSDRPSKHPYYHAGLYYLQEPSAMAPGAIAAAKPGERVLDLCAAPGGKSTQLAAGLGGTGVLVSNDIDADRAKALTKNIELLGVNNAVVTNESPQALAGAFPEWFDLVVVDAPCSGEGMFKKDSQAARSWGAYNCTKCAGMQREILWYAAAMVRKGGRIIYSTCTFAPEEDEQTLDRFLDTFPGWSLAGIPATEGFMPGRPEWGSGRESLSGAVRLWPHRLRGEGHFVAVLSRGDTGTVPALGDAYEPDESAECSNERSGGKSHWGRRGSDSERPNRNAVRTFATTLLPDIPQELLGFMSVSLTPQGAAKLEKRRMVEKRNNLYLLPRESDEVLAQAVTSLNCPRPGWFVGISQKCRFEPSTALATALTPDDAVIPVDYPSTSMECLRYLKCETLPAMDDRNGWALVGTNGFTLGWAKQGNGILKNYYPMWWRWNG